MAALKRHAGKQSRTQPSTSAIGRGSFYLAWGCFRDFGSGLAIHRYSLLRRWSWQTSDGIGLPVGDLGIRMRNDGHEPNGAKQQRPERIPIEPEHRGRSGDLVRSGAIDSLLQSGRRLEHDNATRSNPHLDAALRLAADTRGFLGVFCHSSVSLQS